VVIERSGLGFALSPDGLDVFREIKSMQGSVYGFDFVAIGDWLIDNDYHLYLLYREKVMKKGVTYDSNCIGGFFMESEEHHVAFRMRWF
jgi:hypothetical protein